VRENGGQYSHGASWLVDAFNTLAESAPTPEKAAAWRGDAWRLWCKISPLAHVTAEAIGRYGLPPHQQPADIYAGDGYCGRGGWSWYTGAAARMLSAAYGLLGLKVEGGKLTPLPGSFKARGGPRLRRLWYRGREVLPEEPDALSTAALVHDLHER
jgi:cyclic beta-1,2-glucan synthetase